MYGVILNGIERHSKQFRVLPNDPLDTSTLDLNKEDSNLWKIIKLVPGLFLEEDQVHSMCFPILMPPSSDVDFYAVSSRMIAQNYQ